MRRWLTVAPEPTRYWEDVGAIRWTVIPGLADYHNEADGRARRGPLPHQRADRRQRARRVARQAARQPVLPGRHDVRRHVRQGPPADRRRRGVTRRRPASRRSGCRPPGDEPPAGPLTFGTGVVASFLARVLQEDGDRDPAPRHRVTELLTDDDGAVVGVRAEGPDGPVERARAGRARDQHLRLGPRAGARVRSAWSPEDFGSVAPDSLRGDGIRLARAVGGAIVTIPPTSVPMLPGWPTPATGTPTARSTRCRTR